MEAKIEVPQGMITKLIEAEVVKSLGDKEVLVEAVVKSAMEVKKNSYDKETLFSKQVNEMIRQAASDIFKEWLSDKKGLIQQALLKRLDKEESIFIEKVADQIINSLSKSFFVSCHLKIEGEY